MKTHSGERLARSFVRHGFSGSNRGDARGPLDDFTRALALDSNFRGVFETLKRKHYYP